MCIHAHNCLHTSHAYFDVRQDEANWITFKFGFQERIVDRTVAYRIVPNFHGAYFFMLFVDLTRPRKYIREIIHLVCTRMPTRIVPGQLTHL